MFFSAPNEFKPCGMFTIKHFIFFPPITYKPTGEIFKQYKNSRS